MVTTSEARTTLSTDTTASPHSPVETAMQLKMLPTYGEPTSPTWDHPSYGFREDIKALFGEGEFTSLSQSQVQQVLERRMTSYGIENAQKISKLVTFPWEEEGSTGTLDSYYPKAAALINTTSTAHGRDVAAILEELLHSVGDDKKAAYYQTINDAAFASSSRLKGFLSREASPRDEIQREQQRVHALAAVQAAILLVGRQDTVERKTV